MFTQRVLDFHCTYIDIFGVCMTLRLRLTLTACLELSTRTGPGAHRRRRALAALLSRAQLGVRLAFSLVVHLASQLAASPAVRWPSLLLVSPCSSGRRIGIRLWKLRSIVAIAVWLSIRVPDKRGQECIRVS